MRNSILTKILGASTLLLLSSGLYSQTFKWKVNAVHSGGNHLVNDVASDGQGNSYVTGDFNAADVYFDAAYNVNYTNTDNTNTTYDAYVAKYDRTGALATNSSSASWVALITGSGNTNDLGYSIATYPDGEDGVSVYVCGTFVTNTTLYSAAGTNTPSITLTAPSGNTDGFIAKYDKDGILKWAYDIGGTGSGTDIPYDVCVYGNSVWVCGSFGGTSVIFSHSGSPYTFNQVVSTGDAFLTKYTDNGSSATHQWTRGIGSSSVDAYFATACDANSNCLVTGQIRNTGTIQTNGSGGTQSVTCSGNYEIVAALYNSAGTLSWANHYGSSSTGTSLEAGLAAAMDVNGDCYIGGYYSGTSPVFCSTLSTTTDWSSFVMKILANGTCSWTQTGNSASSGNFDAVQSICVDNCAQRVYATGNYKGSWSFGSESLAACNVGSPNLDGFIAVMDASTGSTTGLNASRLAGSSHDDNGRAISVNSVEDIFIGGSFASSTWEGQANDDNTGGFYEGYLARLDYSDWPSTASSGTTVNQGLNVVDCEVYATGVMSSNSVVFSPQGTISATQNNSLAYSDDTYFTAIDKYANGYDLAVALTSGKGNEKPSDMATDRAGSFYIAGTATTTASAGPDINFIGRAADSYTIAAATSSAFLIKTNSSGSNQWVNTVRSGSTNAVVGTGTAVDGSGNAYLCGYFTGTATFYDQSGMGTTTLTSSGSNDIFVVKYNSSGVIQWKKSFGSASGNDIATAISLDLTSSNYYITGSYTGTIVMVQTLTSAGSSDCYVMRGSPSTGNATCSISYGGVLTDNFYDIYANNTVEVYVAGVKSVNSVAASFDMSSTTTPTKNWDLVATSSSGSGSGNAIVLGDNGYNYMAGYVSAAQTFGSTVVGPGAYVLKIASWSGGAYCQSTYSASSCNEIAVDHGANAFDNGDNEYICGGAGTPTAYIDKVSADGCAQSQRLGHPHAATASATAISTTANSTVYPNPLSGSAVIELYGEFDLGTKPATIIITDMTGREIRRIEGVTSNRIEIDGGDMSNGIYLYEIVQSGTVISNGKMMIQH